MPMTSQEMIKLLKKNGFKAVSQNGSHVKLKKAETGRMAIVPYHSKERIRESNTSTNRAGLSTVNIMEVS
jgi:mRNA interferase HicA